MSLKDAVAGKKKYNNPYTETALLEVKKESEIPVFVRIPESMHVAFKAKCVHERITISEVVTNAIADFLEK